MRCESHQVSVTARARRGTRAVRHLAALHAVARDRRVESLELCAIEPAEAGQPEESPPASRSRIAPTRCRRGYPWPIGWSAVASGRFLRDLGHFLFREQNDRRTCTSSTVASVWGRTSVADILPPLPNSFGRDQRAKLGVDISVTGRSRRLAESTLPSLATAGWLAWGARLDLARALLWPCYRARKGAGNPSKIPPNPAVTMSFPDRHGHDCGSSPRNRVHPSGFVT